MLAELTQRSVSPAELADEDAKVEAAKERYLDLLKKGREKSYSPPIADSNQPIVLYLARPNYTEEAIKDGIQGNVRVVTMFMEDGSIDKSRLIALLPDGLNEQALVAINRTIFLPAVKNGSFSSVRKTLEVEFALGGTLNRGQTQSAPIPPPGGPGEAEGLAPPVQLSPATGSAFDTNPRTIMLQWAPVAGAASYNVEVDCFQCCQKGRWCADVGKNFQVFRNIQGTQYTFDFVGAQPGRWRVWASDEKGRDGASSPWWDFSCTR
ncbi:MAG TPA: energy transducer TonB [Blastocatellia bacterium]|nr:energy transducer TonB [Blastocatellia bacterium]